MKINSNKKNYIRKALIFVVMLFNIPTYASIQNQVNNKNNTLTANEINQGWQLLFDGKTEGQWRGFKKTEFPDNWQVIDGTLHMKVDHKTAKQEVTESVDLVFPQLFENFILKLEWKISEKGNSGVFYLANENHPKYSSIWQTAPEMQILDNLQHPDANRGTNGNRQAGSLYDLIPAQPQNAYPVGQWNNIEIIVNNKKVTHKQNGVVVVQYKIDSPQWSTLIANSKFPTYNPNWSKVANKGLIGLQDHGDHVWFRNIKIKQL